MCEIFGAYGWGEGVRLEKYLLDHFMVRGINHFVPHAFSAKEYPDPDCPPHFYAHGNHPQYRHFGALMAYGNRVLELLNGGVHIAPAAVLYHGESEWMGEAMASDVVGHQLYDHQIDYDYIPQDVFLPENAYNMEITYGTERAEGSFRVNTQNYRVLIVPKLQFITPHMKAALKQLQAAHFPVYFVDGLPEGVEGKIVPLSELAEMLEKSGISEISITPENNRIRYYHYEHADGSAVYMFVNEGNGVYEGTVEMPESRACYVYDAWENTIQDAEAVRDETAGITKVSLVLEPLKSYLLVFEPRETAEAVLKEKTTPISGEGVEIPFIKTWQRSICRSIEYPYFKAKKEVTIPDRLHEEEPEFSGFVRYENRFKGEAAATYILEISDAYEGVEVFLNGKSLGIQIVPSYRYELNSYVKDGENEIAIEVATTLERETAKYPNPYAKYIGQEVKPSSFSGITGEVRLLKHENEM